MFVRLVLSTFFLFCLYVTLVLSVLSFLFVCYISSNRAVVSVCFYINSSLSLSFLFVFYTSYKRAMSFVFVCHVSCNRSPSFLFVSYFLTLVQIALCFFYLFVTLVLSALFLICLLLTLVVIALYLFCLFVILFVSTFCFLGLFFSFIVSALCLYVLKFDHGDRHFEFCLETWLLTRELRSHTFQSLGRLSKPKGTTLNCIFGANNANCHTCAARLLSCVFIMVAFVVTF